MRKFMRTMAIILTLIVSLVLLGPILLPVPPLRDTTAPANLADADSQFMDLGEWSIHYTEAGQGDDVLILLHGFGASVFSWREVIGPYAGAGYRVLAYDRPAYGLTSRPMPGEWTGESPYSFQAQITQLVGLMDAWGIERAVLVGNSAGGAIALAAGLQHPERVRALILVSPAIYSSGGGPAGIRPLLTTPHMRRLGPWFLRRLLSQGDDLIRSAWFDPDKVSPEILAGYRRPLRAENWDRALWEAVIADRDIDLPSIVSQVDLPTLVVTGAEDTWVPADESRRLADELPQARLIVIEQCGHVAHEECPTTFLAAAMDFLSILPNE